MWHLVIDVLKSGRLEQATSFTRESESESDLEVVVVVVDDVGDRAREQHRARRIQPDNQTLIGSSSTTYTIQRDVVNTKRPWSCDCS